MEPVACRMQKRLSRFMVDLDFREQSLRSQMFSVELRKAQRSEQAKRKRLSIAGQEMSAEQIDFSGIIGENEERIFPELARNGLSGLQKLEVLRDILASASNPEQTQLVLRLLRKMLSRQSASPISALVNLDFLPLILRNMDPHHSPIDIVAEAAWILCNLATGLHEVADAMISLGSIAAFIRVLQTCQYDIRESALLGLGNLSLDCPSYRDLVLEAGAHTHIANLILDDSCKTVSLLSTAAWTISALVAHREKPSWNVCRVLLPAVKKLLEYRDTEVMKNTLVTLAKLSEGEYAHFVVEKGIVATVVDLMRERSVVIAEMALKVVGNLAAGSDETTNLLLAHRVLFQLIPLLNSPSARTRSDAYWTLSNITAGTQDQARTVLEHEVCVEAFAGFRDTNFKVRKEASYVFLHIARKLEVKELVKLVDKGILKTLKFGFEGDVETIRNSLILSCGLLLSGEETSTPNRVCALFESTGCIDAVDKLQAYENEGIAREAADVVDRFFGFEATDERLTAPSLSNSEFVFS